MRGQRGIINHDHIYAFRLKGIVSKQKSLHNFFFPKASLGIKNIFSVKIYYVSFFSKAI